VARFQDNWDTGRYKAQVLADSQRGWHDLALPGSPTFILPDGSRHNDVGMGHIDFDEQSGEIRHFTPYPGDPLDAFRKLLDGAVKWKG
jgi:hypothetical protein